jgi:hypothetical protein
MMNPEIKKDWCEALRSGEYQQTTKRLRTPEGFCCMGVLEDRRLKSQGLDWQFEEYDMEYYTPESENAVLTNECMEWAGLEMRVPILCIPGEDFPVSVGVLNDSMGYTLEQLADLIEAQL